MPVTPFFDALQAHRWQEAVAAPLAELNLQVIEAVVAWAGPPARSGGLSWLWRNMGAEARERAAGCRFLLLDLGLARPELWSTPAAGAARPFALLPATPSSLAAAGPALEPGLLRRALLYAWHLTRAHRQPARVALGMATGADDALAAFSLTELDRLAELRPAHMRPRWLDHGQFWQCWLEASAQGQRSELERLQFWGLQRLAAEVLARPP